MTAFLIFIGVVATILLIAVAAGGISIWICKATNPCLHSYERVDTYDDKKMILVCRRCGKIKKLRK